MPRINARLIKGLDRDEATKFIKEYELAKKILQKIRNEIHKEIESSYIKEEHLDELSLAKLAELLGYRRGLREALLYLPEEQS